MITSQGSPSSATAVYQRDTTFAALGATDDTTGWFNLKDADPQVLINGAANDTLPLAYLALVVDTTVTFTTSTTNVVVAFQVAARPATSNASAAPLFSTTSTSICVMTSGDRLAMFPIALNPRGHSGNSADIANLFTLGDFSFRGIVTGVTGGGMAMARAYVVYFDADE